MKILILGGRGMLGHKLVQKFREKFEVGLTVRKNSRQFYNVNQLSTDNVFILDDVLDYSELEKVVFDFMPDVIINAVGIIKQSPEMENSQNVWRINAEYPHQLFEIAGKINSRLICISTDCVFNGKKGNYSEIDKPDAEDFYGKSKCQGEVIGKNCLTIRTSIIGRELEGRNGLVEWFLSNEGETVRGFQNAVFSGFPTIILADILADIISKFPGLEGLYHIASQPINKLKLLQLIKTQAQLKIKVVPDEDLRIDRSLNGGNFERAANFKPQRWEKMIETMFEDSFPYQEFRNEKFGK